MTRKLERPIDLHEAVKKVIRDNRARGYTPTRFMNMTGNGDKPELLSVCQQLLKSDTAFEAIYTALLEHGSLLTIEDYVVRWGDELGFDDEYVKIAKERSEAFDGLVGCRRFE